MLAEKRCTICKQMKGLEAFRRYRGRGISGRRPLCVVCQRKYEANWRLTSKEARRQSRAKRQDRDKVYRREWITKKRALYLVSECRRRCKRKQILFDLDQWVPEIQTRMDKGLCELTGYPLALQTSDIRRPNSPSLDRKNPKKGYVIDNIRIVCLSVNLAISDWGDGAVLPIYRQWMK